MKDYQARLERLLAEAEDCELIARLSTDRVKAAHFHKLAQQYRQMADEVREVIAGGSAQI